MSKFSISLMNLLANALENFGFTAEDLTQLHSRKLHGSENWQVLNGLWHVLQGHATFAFKRHVINLKQVPAAPLNWIIGRHLTDDGCIVWNPNTVKLHQRTKTEGEIRGFIFQEELYAKYGKRLLTATVLDYLLAYPEIIPTVWTEEKKPICFFGTIFHPPGGMDCIQCLTWEEDGEPSCAWVELISTFGGPDKDYRVAYI